jgi:hypothetical protein
LQNYRTDKNTQQSRIKGFRVFDEYLCERSACAEPGGHDKKITAKQLMEKGIVLRFSY